MRMKARLRGAALGTLVTAALALPGQAAADMLGYCDPAHTQFDPLDVPKEGSAPVPAAGVTERSVELAGVETRLLEAGDSTSETAVVFLHGSPGSGSDWVELMSPLAAGGARAIAFDLPGYGHAEPTWGTPRTLGPAADFLEAALDQLGVQAVHLVAHDIGGPIGLEWAARHPNQLLSATLIDTGLMLGYRHHGTAQISRTPEFGETFWMQMTRPFFNVGIQEGQSPQRPLPLDYVNRLYDDLDRETRCAIIDLYRSSSEEQVNAFAHRQAEILRLQPERPALVLWGGRDPYLPAAMAERQRQGFPSARVEIFEDSGHWPFADNPERTKELVVPFLQQVTGGDGAAVQDPAAQAAAPAQPQAASKQPQRLKRKQKQKRKRKKRRHRS
jgi:pimeloyl-ACP methyl ester carboxylesterase